MTNAMGSTGEAVQIVLPGVVEPDGLQVTRGPVPVPGAGKAVVSVEASGISFAEQQMRLGKYYDQPSFPFVPGYDLVGRVAATGDGVDPGLVGTRVAVLTKTGGWASHAEVDAGDMVPVPAEVDPAEAETVVVNGITAWQMLHRIARVRAGQTILVLGATGGVGSTLVQLARRAGIRVIGTASARNQEVLRQLGAEPIDYRNADVPARVRELAPDGVDAVFDHVGGAGLHDSYRLLGKGGTLVSYGSASTKNVEGNSRLPVLLLIGRLLWWNVLPNGRRAHFYNLWAGRRNKAAFQARMREDLGRVLDLLASGTISAQIGARLPLERAGEALRLAESGTVTGKVVLVPGE